MAESFLRKLLGNNKVEIKSPIVSAHEAQIKKHASDISPEDEEMAAALAGYALATGSFDELETPEQRIAKVHAASNKSYPLPTPRQSPSKHTKQTTVATSPSSTQFVERPFDPNSESGKEILARQQEMIQRDKKATPQGNPSSLIDRIQLHKRISEFEKNKK